MHPDSTKLEITFLLERLDRIAQRRSHVKEFRPRFPKEYTGKCRLSQDFQRNHSSRQLREPFFWYNTGSLLVSLGTCMPKKTLASSSLTALAKSHISQRETQLDQYLLRNPLPVAYKHPHIEAGRIMDFFFPVWKLDVELDGPFHDKAADVSSDVAKAEVGIATLRLPYLLELDELRGHIDCVGRMILRMSIAEKMAFLRAYHREIATPVPKERLCDICNGSGRMRSYVTPGRWVDCYCLSVPHKSPHGLGLLKPRKQRA
jgi:very-short-patch-repair endonuclease